MHSRHKFAVLSLTGDETQEGSQGGEVRPRLLDGTVRVYLNEHRIPEEGKKPIREKLLLTLCSRKPWRTFERE